jgi:deoxyribodipyrimidine photo-lyase
MEPSVGIVCSLRTPGGFIGESSHFFFMNTIDKLSSDPRVFVRKAGPPNMDGSCVVYWMQRAQRALDNPALDVAVNVANELKNPVVAFFAPVPFYPHANLRHYTFLAEGIPDIARGLAQRGVGLVFRPYPAHHLLKFCEEIEAAIVIGDENPLRETEEWRERVTQQIRVPFWTVEADVIVPSRLLRKEHYAARTIRPRINELLPKFLVPLTNPVAQKPWEAPPGLRSESVQKDFVAEWNLDRSVSGSKYWQGGTGKALNFLEDFTGYKLADYPVRRNRPQVDGTSRLSPYLHFGHIGPHTVALAVQQSDAPAQAKQAFLEQLIVRRELAVNFVRFNAHYDSLNCVEPWANRSFAEHAGDERKIVYSDEQIENAETHDPLFNAAHKQAALTGWMHNYLRMYWAKKILEWSSSIAVAYRRAVCLNDRYELDGRDPNGYAGIAWAIVGKHDRPWFDRPIFGQVRYMSYASTSRKFDSKRYIEQIEDLEKGTSLFSPLPEF